MIEEQELSDDSHDQSLTTIRLEVDQPLAAATEAESLPLVTPTDQPDQPDSSKPSAAQSSAEPAPLPSSATLGRGCMQQSLTVLSSVVLALLLMVGVAFLLGYTPWELALLREENAALQAQVADMGRKNREMELLADEFRANNNLMATIKADLAANQNMLMTAATAQAGKDRRQDGQIAELEARAERINTFLATLSDIAGQAITGEAGLVATPTSTITPEPTSPAPGVTIGPVETVIRELEDNAVHPDRTRIGPPAATTRTQTATPTATIRPNE